MKIKLLLLSIFAFTQIALGQVVTTEPALPTEKDSIVVYFHADQSSAALKNYTGEVYAHTGVYTSKSPNTWAHVIGAWGNNSTQPKLTRIDAVTYKLEIGDPRKFYNITDAAEHITSMNFVFRASTGSPQSEDVLVPVYDPGLNVSFVLPNTSPIIVHQNDTIKIKAVASEESNMWLLINGVGVADVTDDTLDYTFVASEIGKFDAMVYADNNTDPAVSDTFFFVSKGDVAVAPIPSGTKDGINYIDNRTAVLVLYAPQKEFVYLLGDFNNWDIEPSYEMNITPDSTRFWIRLSNLNPQTEYAFQYLVDGEIRIADPYTEKVLDPWNDKWISSSTYPNLIPYPTGKTENIVSVLQIQKPEYSWQVENFEKPEKENLIIYELLVRDFLSTHDFKTLKDTLSYLKKLGVNAIELMPVNEFEGNESWGYNPSFYFAVDKYYGTKNDFKAFVDEAHKNGIAVIIDMVLNHSFGQSPMVRLYWDGSKPAANSPWFNQTPKHDYNVGFDFNHESQATREFSKRVMEFWLNEFKIDGYRFDLSKGFTQKQTLGNVGLWGQYDQSRIDIWDDYSKHIWSVDSSAYVILEHFADNNEEKKLSSMGMMLWGNENHDYNQATMGHPVGPPGTDWTWNFSGISYKSRGWAEPNLVGFMESHDEERLMHKNIEFGNSSNPEHNVKDTSISIQRIKLASAFFFTVPGPKMIWQFGELGYDYSIDFNGRVGNKPVRWDYLNQPNRVKLYKTMAAILKLRNENPEVFSSNTFVTSLAGATKRITITHSKMHVNIIGNFDVTAKSMSAQFPSTGMWYNYFSGDSLEVSNTTMSIELQPGEFHIYTTVKQETPAADILTDVQSEENEIAEITTYELLQNYPNPFNPATTINYQIPEAGKVTLKIYNILGKEIATLVNEIQSAGNYKVNFNASNLPSGVYFYKIDAGKFSNTRKMMLVK